SCAGQQIRRRFLFPANARVSWVTVHSCSSVRGSVRGEISVVSNKNKSQYESQFSIKHALENLRIRIVDTESVAHAAEDTLQYLPYIPRAPHQMSEPGDEVRVNFGRLHSLVVATSANARKLLEEINQIIERLYQQP